MRDKIKKSPSIRFSGFIDEWEQQKLGELSDIYDGTHQTPKYTDSGVMFLSVENIKTLQSEKYISEEDFEKEFKIFPKRGDVLMTRIGDIGTTNLVETNEPKAYYVSLALLRPRKLNPYFLKESISSETVKKELWHRTLHIAFPKKINKNEIADVSIPYPKSEEEQQQIGEFLKKLDNIIILHQRKLELLKATKKSMLQKMFPKDGESVPEFRFAGFTDVWEQRKLGDILKRRQITQLISEDAPRLAFASGQGVIPLSERKTNNRDQLISDETTKKYLLTEIDDIVYNPANLKYGAIDRNKYGKGVISPIYVTFTTQEEPSFIERIVTTENFKTKALKFEEGTVTKRQSVRPECLLSLEVMISTSKKEQREIGNFFQNLDRLITLHQRELDLLKDLKKSMLQQMFI